MQESSEQRNLLLSVIESVVEEVDGALHLEVGDYKLVSWSSTVHLPAQITSISDATDNIEIEVSAMTKRGKDIFVWDCQCGQVADGLASCTTDGYRDISYISANHIIDGNVELVPSRRRTGYKMLFTPAKDLLG